MLLTIHLSATRRSRVEETYFPEELDADMCWGIILKGPQSPQIQPPLACQLNEDKRSDLFPNQFIEQV